MTCANMYFVVQDLLIDRVVNLSAILCGGVGCAAGMAAGVLLGGGACVPAGAISGCVAGWLAGGAMAGILSSGTKTLLALWAENPEPLRRYRPDIHQELEARILAKLGC